MPWSKTYAGTAPLRVNKWLAQESVCSRREAEGLIAQGLVSIDGARIEDAGHKIAPGQTLMLADAAHKQLDAAFTALVNKPVGYVSAQPERDQIPAARLVTRENLHGEAPNIPSTKTKLAPLGRLDQDSRGLLLLSQDGVLAKAVIGPASALEKEYLVRFEGRLTDRKLALLAHGLRLDGRALKPAQVSQMGEQTLCIILKEGRNRQIRRMCEAADLAVTDLLRVRIGPLSLGDLPEGKWRPLAPAERAGLLERSD